MCPRKSPPASEWLVSAIETLKAAGLEVELASQAPYPYPDCYRVFWPDGEEPEGVSLQRKDGRLYSEFFPGDLAALAKDYCELEI